MARIFRIALVIVVTVVAAALGLSLIGTIEIPSNASAQENAQLGRLFDLVLRKGFENPKSGSLCESFQIKGRASDGECKFISFEGEDDDVKGTDYPKGWYPVISVLVEQGTGLNRIIFSTINSPSAKNLPTGSAYSFLTGSNGKLLRALSGRKRGEGYLWSAMAIDANLEALFAKQITFWLNEQKSIEGLPDRKN